MLSSLYYRFQSKPLFKKAIKGIAYLGSEKLIKIVVGLFVHAFVARYLTPEGYGKLSYVLNFGLAFIPFVLLGIDDVVTKDLLDKNKNVESIVNEVFGLRFMGAMTGFVLLNLVNYLLNFRESPDLFTYIASYSFFLFFNVFYVFELPFLSEINTKTIFWARTLAYFSGTTARLSSVLLKLTLPFFVLTYYVDELIHKSFVFIRYLKRNSFRPVFAWSGYKRDLMAKSWPLFVVLFFSMLEQRISFYFLERMKDLKLLGYFSVSYTLIDLWVFVPFSICTTLYPIIVRNKTENEQLYQERTQLLIDACIWLALGLIIGTHLTSKIVIHLLYGPKYAGAESILDMMSFFSLIYFYNIARLKIFTIEGKIRAWGLLSFMSLLIYTVLLYIGREDLKVSQIVLYYFIAHLTANLVLSIWEPLVRKTLASYVKSVLFPIRMLHKYK